MRGALAALTVIVSLVAAAPVRAATAPSDAWMEGYAAAVLERELKVPAPSVRVQDGVLTLNGAELGDVDRARVEALLRGIRGVTRVQILAAPPPAAVPPVAVPPVATPAAT